jgi:hypothetical protein
MPARQSAVEPNNQLSSGCSRIGTAGSNSFRSATESRNQRILRTQAHLCACSVGRLRMCCSSHRLTVALVLVLMEVGSPRPTLRVPPLASISATTACPRLPSRRSERWRRVRSGPSPVTFDRLPPARSHARCATDARRPERFFGVEILDQLHRAFDICEQCGDRLALAVADGLRTVAVLPLLDATRVSDSARIFSVAAGQAPCCISLSEI